MNNDASLATLENGQVPKTRMSRGDQVQDFVRKLVDADEKRARKRSMVSGLVGGNPPYKASALKKAGRAEACNVNWGTAHSYMESGAGAFYDLTSEAPGFVSIQTRYGEPERRVSYSRIMSAEADRIFATDPVWDYEMQQSQNNMTLHGCGPLMFEDEFKVLPKAFQTGDLKVPERTKSDTHYWESCVIIADYYPHELYAFIKNEAAATKVGWDVPYTKKVIENAMNLRDGQGQRQSWEFHQQELKNNSLGYCDETKICRLAHGLWKEFDGKITQVIVEQETTAGNDNANPFSKDTSGVKFLFQHIGRYDSWNEAIHPMYFDRGNSGFHHSVSGLGVKMFSGMEYENRLMCNLMDKAFAPKILFKPNSSEASQKFQLAHHGDWGLLPAGYDVQQVPIQGFLTDGLALHRASSEVMRSNLSSYRQQVPTKDGNPVTARQVMLEASQSSALSKTTFNRYYKQLDLLYTEVVRRLCIGHSTDERAKEFRKRCKEQGVPEQCFEQIEKVEAVRVVGQGSAFMRKASIDAIKDIVGSLPEEGRENWITDKISAEAGQSAVARWFPRGQAQNLASDQQAEALQWVGSMKVGVPPVVTSSQNPSVYASTFLTAAVQALQSLQQGGDPNGVYAFLKIAGPAVAAHLKRMAKDPTRAGAFKQMMEQWKQLAGATDKLAAQLQQMAQKRKAMAAQSQQVMTDEQIKMMKLKGDETRKNAKTAQQLKTNALKTRQSMALADAKTASEIGRDNMRAEAESAEPLDTSDNV
jgi:hypothetical protein